MTDYRHHNGLSQADIAAKMGMRQQLYSNIEVGRTKLSIEFVERFKELFGVDLLRDTTPPPFVPKQPVDLNCEQEIENLRREIAHKEEIISILKLSLGMKGIGERKKPG
jgi:transcriptional regulator with XRE-family HTH domain